MESAMATQRSTTIQLGEVGIPAVGAMLGRAFFDDPLWRWVVPDDAQRRAALGPFMAAGVRYGVAHGRVDATSEHAGGAVWLRPGDSDFDPERGLALGLDQAPRLLGDDGMGRFLTAMGCLTEPHHRLEPDAHWYLMILGVDPPMQRRGLGADVLRPVLDVADASRLRCYLETQKPDNVPFYRAQGFAVREELDLPDGGPHLWLMSRAPRAR
jgi:GNAT superfamily N-acetyltransferase